MYKNGSHSDLVVMIRATFCAEKKKKKKSIQSETTSDVGNQIRHRYYKIRSDASCPLAVIAGSLAVNQKASGMGPACLLGLNTLAEK